MSGVPNLSELEDCLSNSLPPHSVSYQLCSNYDSCLHGKGILGEHVCLAEVNLCSSSLRREYPTVYFCSSFQPSSLSLFWFIFFPHPLSPHLLTCLLLLYHTFPCQMVSILSMIPWMYYLAALFPFLLDIPHLLVAGSSSLFSAAITGIQAVFFIIKTPNNV